MINIGNLMEWCKQNSAFPTEENRAFVLGHDLCSISDEMSFRFTILSPLLRKKLAARETICIDVTYKLNSKLLQ